MLDYFFRRKIQSRIKNYSRKHVFLNYKDIHKILVLFDIEDWYDIAPIIEQLQQEGKDVIAWTIKPKKTQIFKFPEYVTIIDADKDLNWMGLFKEEIVSKFQLLDYDTVLDLRSGESEYLTLLLTYNKGQFIISLIERALKLHDFILHKNEEQSLQEAFQSTKKYLQQIQ